MCVELSDNIHEFEWSTFHDRCSLRDIHDLASPGGDAPLFGRSIVKVSIDKAGRGGGELAHFRWHSEQDDQIWVVVILVLQINLPFVHGQNLVDTLEKRGFPTAKERGASE